MSVWSSIICAITLSYQKSIENLLNLSKVQIIKKKILEVPPYWVSEQTSFPSKISKKKIVNPKDLGLIHPGAPPKGSKGVPPPPKNIWPINDKIAQASLQVEQYLDRSTTEDHFHLTHWIFLKNLVDICPFVGPLLVTSPGANPELLVGGGANPWGGRLPNILIIFTEKPHEIKEILVRGRGGAGGGPRPPKSTTGLLGFQSRGRLLACKLTCLDHFYFTLWILFAFWPDEQLWQLSSFRWGVSS